jgi:hypothetical protein
MRQMTTRGISSPESAAWDSRPKSDAPTLSWFVRRSALWATIVIIAVISACALYAVVSGTEPADLQAAPNHAANPLKV